MPAHPGRATKNRPKGGWKDGLEGELFFELLGPDGHFWRPYGNGRADAFPEGNVIVNKPKLLLDSMRGEQQLPCTCITHQQSKTG